jgi:hypothetical protein
MLLLFLLLLKLFIHVVNFDRELLKSKLHHLLHFLLAIESIDQSTLLGDLEEFDVQVLLLHAAVADAELHKELFQLGDGRVLKRSYSHGENPESDGVVEVLRLRQTMVQEVNAHF